MSALSLSPGPTAAQGPPEGPEWRVSGGLTGYREAVAFMEARAAAIREGTEGELVWLVEHPPLYTAGTSARDTDLLTPERFPVHKTGRGGEYTYHGPGQRVAYAMVDLKARAEARGAGPDLRAYVRGLEEWIIRALARFNVQGERRDGRIGIWVARTPDGTPLETEKKIAAIGVRVRKWVAFHGIALNVEPELEHFSGIVPCGIRDYGVTSLVDLGLPVTMADADAALRAEWDAVFESDKGQEKR